MQTRTKRQREVLDYITRFVDRNGHEPSYQQIARHLGVSSKAGVQRHIAALENQGFISRRRENGSFSIELRLRTAAKDSVCVVELVEVPGTETGPPQPVHSLITLPKIMIGSLSPEEVFGFRVSDDSMVDKQIWEGDILLLERRSYARRGDVVVVLTLGKQMLVGQYYQRGLETEIRPASSDFEPMIFPADEVAVQGVMRGMLRPIPPHEDQE